MLLPVYIVFLLVMAFALTGWGALALPGRRLWTQRFGAGTLTVFFLISAAGWSGILLPGFLWVLLGAGLILWARPGRFVLPSGWLMVSLCGIAVLPLALMPPASRDALIHHLYQARLWVDAGRIIRPDWSGFFSYPYLTEALYAMTGGTFGFRVSRAVSLLGFMAACAVPVSLFLRQGRKREALVSLLVLVSIPELFRNASWSYSDTFLVFFSLLAYTELTSRKGSPFMAVVWASAAGCCKYNGLLVLASVLVLIPFHFRDISRRTFIASISAAAFISAWWALPNLIQWGNPVYPLLGGIFGGRGPETERAAAYFASASFSTSLKGLGDYLLLPVRMSLHGRWNDPALFDGASGPLLLAGTILAVPVLADRRRKFLLPMLYMVLTLVFKGRALRTRYLLPGMAMLSIPVAEALVRLYREGGRIVRLATVILVAVCLVWSGSRMMDLYALERPWRFSSDQEYLAGELRNHEFFTECGRFVAPEDTTLMVNIGRVFYYPGYAVFDESRAPVGLLRMFWSGMDAGGVADSLRNDGVSLVASDMFLTSINVPTVLEPGELLQWRAFVSKELSPLLTMDGFVLFRLE